MAKASEVLINEKINSVLRCLDRIKSKKPASEAALAGDLDAQDIISLNLERATQCCVDIAAHIISRTQLAAPKTMTDAFASLVQGGLISEPTCVRMQKAVGMRNVLVHQYQELNWSIIWTILENHLVDYIEFTTEIRAALKGK
jgi:uncharacterized protein YutE (UPF0331/DUF86 family)